MIDLIAVRSKNPDYFVSTHSKYNLYIEYLVLTGKMSLKYFLIIGYRHLNLYSLFELNSDATVKSDIPIDFESLHEVQSYLKRN